jgi:hypothetical protein
MEKPMSLYRADFIELASEHLLYHMEHWTFSHGTAVSKDIEDFCKWCFEQDKIALHEKRGKENTSFYERREKAKSMAKKPNDYYEDIRHCDHCDKDTPHTCKDDTHERDSSQDYQQCLTCKWWMMGFTRKYNPPFGDEK